MKPVIDPKVKSLTTRICLVLLLISIAINGMVAVVVYHSSHAERQQEQRQLQEMEQRVQELEQRFQAIRGCLPKDL